MTEKGRKILIIEDGDEYLRNLSAFIPSLCYLQAHSAAEALSILQRDSVDLVFLDMRFDRSDRSELLGDIQELLDGFASNEEQALAFLARNQGLYIARALRQAGYRAVPILISYDFSRESARWEAISRDDPRFGWVPDASTPEIVLERILSALNFNSTE